MDTFYPREVREEEWRPLVGSRAYAVRSGPQDFVYLRLGKGKGFYMSIAPTKLGRVITAIDYESGGESILQNLTPGASLSIGRSQECRIKIIHAYISRQHAELFFNDDILMIRDLGSINGTFIHSQGVCFDIEEYLLNHPIDQMKTSTMDVIHEAFGPRLHEFLKRYIEKKETIT